jgi:hypothetical protein
MIELTRYKRYKETYRTYYQLNKAKIQAQMRQWRENNRPYDLERQRRWRQAHPDNYRKFMQKHPERVKAKNLMAHNPDKYPLDDACTFCGDTAGLEHGHIDYDYPELYLTVCRKCNIWMDNGRKME